MSQRLFLINKKHPSKTYVNAQTATEAIQKWNKFMIMQADFNDEKPFLQILSVKMIADNGEVI